MNTHRWFRDILLFGYENGSVIMKQFEDKNGLNLNNECIERKS